MGNADFPLDLTKARRVRLGASDVEVSRLCLGLGSSLNGCLSMQGHLAPDEVAAFLVDAFQRGVTWWDTSDNYGTEPHVRAACAVVGREQVQITTKSHAAQADALRRDLEGSLRALGTSYVDVYLLHEVDSPDELAQREGAVRALRALQAEGLVRLVGLSTHNIDVLEAVAGDPRFDVLLTNYNVAGVHMDADRQDYARALRKAFDAGQATVLMKTLGEGALASRFREALEHNLALDFAHGVVVGVTSLEQARQAAALWDRFCGPSGPRGAT